MRSELLLLRLGHLKDCCMGLVMCVWDEVPRFQPAVCSPAGKLAHWCHGKSEHQPGHTACLHKHLAKIQGVYEGGVRGIESCLGTACFAVLVWAI
jgi:hypothetical protein